MGGHKSYYSIDLELPPEQRWRPLLSSQWARKESRKLAQEAFEMSFNSPLTRQIGKLLKQAAHLAFKIIGTGELDYMRDVQVWGEVIGDKPMASMANLSYELYGLINVPFNRLGLCSSVAFYRPRLGMVHLRNLDWPVFGIRKATILVDFDAPAGKFTAVTMPGFCGVLSGVAKRRFSATINANEDHTEKYWPNFRGWGASFLLRWIFEYCESYEEALRVLRREPGFVPFFVQLVGTKRGQACVVAVNTSGKNKVYKYRDSPLGVSNHHPHNPAYYDKEWEITGPDGEMLIFRADSIGRLERIEWAASRCKAKTLRGTLSVLRQEPIWNECTVQSMAFLPKTGQVLLQPIE